jgi:hypothetical protein
MIKHLTEEEIAICAEALDKGNYQSLPHNIREHVAHCDQCADEILMVADIAKDKDLFLKPEAPKKDKAQKIIAWSVSVAAAIALILLLIDISDSTLKKGETLLTQETISPKQDSDQDSSTAKTDQTTETADSEKQEPVSPSGSNEIQKSSDKELIAKSNQKISEQTEEDKSMPATAAPTGQMPSTGAPSSGVPPHLREKADTLKFLAHFEPNEELEKLTERFKGNLRSTDEIEVISPLSLSCSKSSITIKWKNPQKKRLIIEVFNNKGERILETETTEEVYTLQNLNNGLYYWKLISEDFELLFCGRIEVNN